MVPPFKMFMGGPLGLGNQWTRWIHIEEEIGLLMFLMEQENGRGAFNATSPEAVTMAEFSKALGAVLNRPSWLSIPPSTLTRLTGEMADMLLAGQKAMPEAALKLGDGFKYPTIAAALRSLRL
jgi:uncharacterized protein